MRITNRLTRSHKSAAVALAGAAGVAALTSGVASAASDAPADRGQAKPVGGHSVNVAEHPSTQAAKATTGNGDHATGKSLFTAGETKQVSAAKPASAAEKDDKAEKAEKTAKAKKAEQQKKAVESRSSTKAERSDRSARPLTKNQQVDAWITEARSVMKKNDIPGSHQGIKKNLMRESAGNPKAVNNWDVNAKNGVPSKGLLQTIQPTFDAYHVKGTPKDIYDPVANIVAACNYAADKYGSMDNVDSAY
jgi:hypothetical protein